MTDPFHQVALAVVAKFGPEFPHWLVDAEVALVLGSVETMPLAALLLAALPRHELVAQDCSDWSHVFEQLGPAFTSWFARAAAALRVGQVDESRLRGLAHAAAASSDRYHRALALAREPRRAPG